MTAQPTIPIGFADLNPDAWLRTLELAQRMGYPTIKSWYADAPRRRAAGFPRPRRRGFYHAGSLIDWDRSGGLSRGAIAPHNLAHIPANDPRRPAAEPDQSGDARPLVAARLQELAGRV
jgi:hypothetical protein